MENIMEKKMKYLSSKHFFYLHNIITLFKSKDAVFLGWGRKRTGKLAMHFSRWFHKDFLLLEDGFIRSIGLGVDGSSSFSVVEDDVGIYYDATRPSKLENILNNYDFKSDTELMEKAYEAIRCIKEYHISKYNSINEMDVSFFKNRDKKRILVIAQTAGDASLKYGLGDHFSTDEMINAAIKENSEATVYLKIHPDVLSGKKDSDIDIEKIKGRCQIIDIDVNPISLLKHFNKVYTKTSQMGFEALLLGKDCVCFGLPFYAGWGVTDDRVSCARRKRTLSIEEIFAAAYILYTKYYNPYSKKLCDIFTVIDTIVKYRERDQKIDVKAYFFGFSTWKHPFIIPFIKNIKLVNFVNPFFSKKYLLRAEEKGLDRISRIYIWGKKEFGEIEVYSKENAVDIYRVEDGFIRSVGLGSDLTQPYSLVIDKRGIYFDPMQESDLEHLLNFHQFTQDEIERAKKLRQYLIDKKLSKYNNYSGVKLDLPTNKKIILVPGQVEDDASIMYGAKGMNNLELLKQVRSKAPEAYIIYKPHPDVLAGNRVGHIEESGALKYCDRIINEVSLDSILQLSDEVHTMTSLVGFEAIIRGIKVYTYGLPFYAGWGLSEDSFSCERRQRILSVDELTVATLLLYPRYIDPVTKELCEIEVTLTGLEMERDRRERSFSYRYTLKLRNILSRRTQQIVRFFN